MTIIIEVFVHQFIYDLLNNAASSFHISSLSK